MDQSERRAFKVYEVELNRSDGAWANAWCPVWESKPVWASSAEPEPSGRRVRDFAWADRSDMPVTAGSG